MKKSPPSGLVTFIGIVFIAYGGYGLVRSLWAVWVSSALFGAVAMATGIGAISNRRWSRYCAYFVTATLAWNLLFGVASHLLRRIMDDAYAESGPSITRFAPLLAILATAMVCSHVLKLRFGQPVAPKMPGLGKGWLLLLSLVTMHIASALVSKVYFAWMTGAIEFSYRAYRPAGNPHPATYTLDSNPVDYWWVMIGYGLFAVGMLGYAIKLIIGFCMEPNGDRANFDYIPRQE